MYPIIYGTLPGKFKTVVLSVLSMVQLLFPYTNSMMPTYSLQQSEGSKSVLSLNSLGHVLRAFVNGVLVGKCHALKTSLNMNFYD